MEIFTGEMILMALALSVGWPCRTPLDVARDGLDLMVGSNTRNVDAIIAEDDPFCIVFPSPCVPWNSLMEFIAA